MIPNRTDTLLWTGMRRTGESRYIVVRDHLGRATVLGEVWRSGPAKNTRWNAQRIHEAPLTTTYRTRRDAACVVAGIFNDE